MAQLRQFHLELAFEAARPLGEDIQNQASAIHHAALQEGFQVALLARRQGMVEQGQFRSVFLNRRPNFLGLAAADEQARIRPAAMLDTRSACNPGLSGNVCYNKTFRLSFLPACAGLPGLSVIQALLHTSRRMWHQFQITIGLSPSFTVAL
jgi:hypothetical protein